MPRYIDAEKLRDEVDDTLNWETNNEYNMYSDIMDMIDNAPTEDVQPVKHGKWEKREYTKVLDKFCEIYRINKPSYTCTNCRTAQNKTSNYCPHCGARMDTTQNIETCLFCGEIIPEGRQVCPICERRYDD